MRHELKPYEDYKDSRIDWMGNIPTHWNIYKNSVLFQEVVDTNHTELELLSILLSRGIVKQSSTGRKKRMSQDNSNYKRIQKGDIGYNLMNAFMGSIGASKYVGIISPAYAVCRPKVGINSWYFHYLFRIPLYKKEFDKNSYGIMYERNRLYFDRFKRISSFVPPKDEQDQIVRYLDCFLTKINKFIRTKMKLIEVLKEQKQAVINESITKGLDPSTKMKSSGIDWLGEIPEKWELIKLKFLSREAFQYGANESGVQFSDDLPRYIRITDITSEGNLKDSDKLSLSRNLGEKFILHDSDILFARSGATVGKTFLYKEEYGESCFAGYLIKFSPDTNRVMPEYIYNFTLSSAYSLWLNKIFIQSTIQNVSAEKYKNLQIPLPSLDDQYKILKEIEADKKVFDKVITEILKEISLITEYRTRLISDVVTGKVDVRGIVVDDVLEDIEDTLEEEPLDDEFLSDEDGDENAN